MLKIKTIIILLLLSTLPAFAQTKDMEIGSQNFGQRPTQGGYYDYSDPESVNIKVSVWGYVKFPGKYVVPKDVTLDDILSYAGGPTDDAQLEDLRLYHVNSDSTRELVKLNYSDIWRSDTLFTKKGNAIKLNPGDVIVVPGEPRLHFSNYISLTVSVASALISLAILLFK